MDRRSLARTYYRTIDEGAYEALGDALCEGFTHVRPDRTIEGRDAFVEFMREERPEPDTTHQVEAVFSSDGRVAVEGRLVHDDGRELFRFVDSFRFESGGISHVRTYTD